MISTNIDGSPQGGSGNLMELLSTVASDTGFAAKMKELKDATDRHQQLIDLVGPASEVLQIRDKLKADQDTADQLVAEKMAQAEKIIADAEAKANETLDVATDDADKIYQMAKAQQTAAEALSEQLSRAKADAESSKAFYDTAAAASIAESMKLREATGAMEASRLAFESKKQEILDKHKQFIESL